MSAQAFPLTWPEGRLRDIQHMAADLLALCESDDSHGVIEFMGEMTEAQREALLATLNTTHRYYVEQTTLEAA